MTMIRRFMTAACILVMACSMGAAFASARSFERPGLAEQVQRYQKEISRTASAGERSAADWLKEGVDAVRRNDWRSAYQAFGNAISLQPDNEQSWRNYAIAVLRMEPVDNERWDFPSRALAAAYRTYQLSPDEKAQARALAILAEAYVRTEQYRPALDAYKESLRLNEHPDVRQAYVDTRAKWGFRVTNYRVESDTASPRACMVFSETLAKGRVDFSPFVSVVGMEKPAVSATGDALCVDGLKHGQTYEINVRAGVPSAVDEDSLRPANATIYVRDRKPEVRFTGRNYVLPRTSQQGLPFVSVNVDRVGVEIFRVGDRGLASEITGENFQRQLDAGEIEKLKENKAALVFKGEVEVERQLNTDVTTAVPLDETLKALEAGVYVMLANPAGSEPEYWTSQPTQWFVVSDLGLTALSAKDGVHVFARSLASAEPLGNVEVKLVARNNEVLASAKTDAQGFARFDGALVRGEGALAPALLTAASSEDYGFLALTAPGFDLSDRGVEGRAAPGPLDALVYTERGVYRPGEVVHVTTLLRDADGMGVENLPLTLIVERPDGTEDRRAVVADQGAGGRVLDLPLVSDATTGTWRLKVHAEASRPAIGEVSFLVEDYVPERLDLEIASTAKDLTENGVPVSVQGRWLYGAPAGDLAVEGDVTLRVSGKPLDGLSGYRFGLADEEVAPVRTELTSLGRTDAQGKAEINVARPALPATSRPLEAEIALRLREPGGRTVERKLTLPVLADGPRIGVRPLFGERLGDGETAQFDVRMIAPDASALAAKGVRWEISKLNTRYQWYSQGSDWNYETITTASREADGVVDLTADAPARIEARLSYGRYRLDVMSAEPNGPATSVIFDAGWNVTASNAETPDMLDVALDKPVYTPGERAQLRLDAPFAGRATIAVIGNSVIATQTRELSLGANDISLDVTDAWRPGAYVIAFLHRPLDAAASRMPGRAIGVAHAQIDAAPHTLGIAMEAPEKASPRGTLRVPLKIANLARGENAHIVVAAVDVGILNLTGFEAPAPEKDAFAQRKISADVRDLYGQLIDGMRATRGRLRTGGDAMGGMGMGEPPTQQPLALFSGLVPVSESGEAEVSFDIPAFNGTVRLMAMAWSKDKLGHAEQDVVIADPVVVTAAMPRFLAVGDVSRLRLDIHNVSGAAGEYTITSSVEGDAVSLDAESTTLMLEEGARSALDLALSAHSVGHSVVDVAVTGPDGARYTQSLVLSVKPAAPEMISRKIMTLAANTGSLTIGSELLEGIVPGTGSVSLSVGPAAWFEPAAFVGALETYPYGCSEQLSSRLVAILYAEDFGLTLADDARERAHEMVSRILARQNSSGGFGLWSSDGNDLWLDSYITDVLTRAREKGYEVPERAISQALQRLRNVLGYQGDVSDEKQAQDFAYAHYVLARNGRPIIGDLRYLADSKIDTIASPLARAQIGAALALAGDQTRAARMFALAEAALDENGVSGTSRQDYGTHLRDSAGVLALAAETSNAAVIPAVARKVGEVRGGRGAFSTQENAWLLRASLALKAEGERLALTVDGADHSGMYNRVFHASELADGARVGNAGADPVTATMVVRGAPTEMPEAAAEGLSIERAYFTLEGEAVDPSTVSQNSRLVVTLTIRQQEHQASRLLVVDRLPAGFEIDSPRIVTSADVKSLPWLNQESASEHSEFRDDRYVGAFDRSQAEGDMMAAYIVRAVAPGRYVHPPATVEDMYRVERFARTTAGAVEVTAE